MSGLEGGPDRKEVARLIRRILEAPLWEELRQGFSPDAIAVVRETLGKELTSPSRDAATRRRDRPPNAAERFRLFCDGASSGNPGPSGVGGVILDPEGVEVDRYSMFLGKSTNNVAEYAALLEGLNRLLLLRARSVEILLDSELIVRQLTGHYKVKSPHLLPLYRQVLARLSKITDFQIRHIPRTENRGADALAQQGIAKGKKAKGGASSR